MKAKATIGNVTREVEITPWLNSPDAFDSVGYLGLARKGRGTKLWPVKLTFVKNRAGELVLRTSGYYILNTAEGYLVAWNDAEYEKYLSQHNGAR